MSKEIGYFAHLWANLVVTGRCLIYALFHLLHGLIPCRMTSHRYWGWKWKKKNTIEITHEGPFRISVTRRSRFSIPRVSRRP